MIVEKFSFPQKTPHEPIGTKFGTAARLTNLITHDSSWQSAERV